MVGALLPSRHDISVSTCRRILLFGDAADHPIPLIREALRKSDRSANATLFIRQAVQAVATEVQTLSPQDRDRVGPIHDIHDLQDHLEKENDPLGIARVALLFIARIVEFIL